MLWHKSWLETRWRFAIGLALLVCTAAGVVFTYPEVKQLIPMIRIDAGGELGRRIRESAELARDYRGYVWSQWFGQQLAHTWTLFAVLLGSGGLMSQRVRGGALFTLSLPVSRGRVLAVRAATALAELAVLGLVPTLVVVALSPAVGESYPLGDAVIHAACLVIAGSALFALAFALSTVFSDVWRPPLIALLVAVVLRLLDMVPALARLDVVHVMSAESYFRGDGLPWLGLLASAAAAALLLYAAARNIARQDF